MTVLLSNERESGAVEVRNRWYDAYIERMPVLDGKVAVVTGSNSGIGFWAANALAYRRCHVVLACRSVQKGTEAKDAILGRFPDASVEVMELDNMDLQSVKRFAGRFVQKHQTLDYLINNAGIMTRPHTLSKDGFDCQFQTNHLAHFLLTQQLWKTMMDTPGQSRVVQHSSAFHFLGGVEFDRHKTALPSFRFGFLGLQWFLIRVIFPLSGLHNMDRWLRYFMSKLCGVLFMKKLATKIQDERLQDKIISTACHPGYVSTKLLSQSAENWFGWKLWLYLVAQSAADGSLTLLEAVVGETTRNGDFWGPRFFAVGPPVRSVVRESGNSTSQADDLWLFSEECTKQPFIVQK